MRSLLLRWLTSLVNSKIHTILVIGLCVVTIALPRADCSEIDAYSGLAREYAISQSADFVKVTSSTREACSLLCRHSMKSYSASFPEIQRHLHNSAKPGIWLLLLKCEGIGQPELVRLTADNPSKQLTSYFSDIKRHVDANESIPLSTYFRYLWADHWLVEDDVCNGIARETHHELSQFAASLKLAEIVPQVEDAKRCTPRQARIGIAMLAYSRGSARDKVVVLERLIQEPLKGEWPGQAQNLDAILSALLICDAVVGKAQIESIMASRSTSLEVRKKAMRAVSFGLSQELLSQTEVFDRIRDRLNDFDDVYPEILTLAHVCGVRLDSSEVARMVAHPRIVSKSPEEFSCHFAVVDYYWTQDHAWQADLVRLVAEQDKERYTRLDRRLRLRDTPIRLSHAALEDAIHRPRDGETCHLGATISE